MAFKAVEIFSLEWESENGNTTLTDKITIKTQELTLESTESAVCSSSKLAEEDVQESTFTDENFLLGPYIKTMTKGKFI